MTPLHPIQYLVALLVMVMCAAGMWIGSGPARDQRRARRAALLGDVPPPKSDAAWLEAYRALPPATQTLVRQLVLALGRTR